MRITFILFAFCFLFFFSVRSSTLNHELAVDCDNIEVNGNQYSLSRLAAFDGISTSIGQYLYIFSVCKNVKLPNSEYCGKCQEFGGCQIDESPGETLAKGQCLGEFKNSISDFSGNNNSISITYSNGDTLPDDECWNSKPRQLVVYIECSKDFVGKPTAINIEEPQCDDTYFIRFKHADGCPKSESSPSSPATPKKKGLSVGSIMLIIIFVSFIVYVIAGVIVNLAIRKKEGREIFPNTTFWADLPFLVKDGFMFILGKIRGRGSEYQSVD